MGITQKAARQAARQAEKLKEKSAGLVEKAGEKLAEQSERLAASAGDFVENRIGGHIEGTVFEAPLYDEENATEGQWYRLPIAAASAGDGSGYHIYVKQRASKNLCIFFSGGGVAWDEKMAAQPVTGGRVASGRPNFYWNNLRPFTQIMNIDIGITESRRRNPFDLWNFAVITYATGDFHVGRDELSFEDEKGQQDTLHFCGYTNFTESMKVVCALFPKMEKLLIAGDSAGAFATPALAPEIIEKYYPDAADITIFSDSAQLLRTDWKHTLSEVWHSPGRICDASHSDNLYLDWLKDLMRREGDRCRYLYASSTRDYLLSSFQNEIDHGIFDTDADAQEGYERHLAEMLEQMSALPCSVHSFLYDWKNPLYTKGGTVHTAVRQPYYYQPSIDGTTMAQWLNDAVHGSVYDVGRGLL